MRIVAGSIVTLLFAAAAGLQAAGSGYHLVADIPIGGTGGWDYLTVDPSAHRLYVSHATRIVVVDLDSRKVVGEIADTPGVHGFAIASDLGLGFTSNGRENTSTVVDLKTLKPVRKVMTGGNPDSIMYLPGRREVYTFDGTGKSATVFDARGGQVMATIPLGGKPEEAAFDAAAGRIFVNIEDRNSIGVIDVQKHALVATWPLDGCEEPTGLAFDQQRHRLFSVCGNKVMVATDSVSGKAVARAAIGDRADGAGFDPATGDIFSSNGEGTLTVVRLEGTKLTVVDTIPTQASARTMALDPTTHRLYLPAATMGAAPTGGRAQPVPDTFKVLVFGRN